MAVHSLKDPGELLFDIIDLKPPTFPTTTIPLLNLLLNSAKPLNVIEISSAAGISTNLTYRMTKKLSGLGLVNRISIPIVYPEGHDELGQYAKRRKRKDWGVGQRVKYTLNREATLMLLYNHLQALSQLKSLLEKLAKAQGQSVDQVAKGSISRWLCEA